MDVLSDVSDARDSGDTPRAASRKRNDSVPISAEPLREQIFAAFGYAFAFAAILAGLLTSHLGTAGLIASAVFGALLVPANLVAIRGRARLARRFERRVAHSRNQPVAKS